jgi:hypothetical protein
MRDLALAGTVCVHLPDLPLLAFHTLRGKQYFLGVEGRFGIGGGKGIGGQIDRLNGLRFRRDANESAALRKPRRERTRNERRGLNDNQINPFPP